tara:strand:+ start:161 stop:760 length:600 start_codon:yes stop_codon:yes gene_type:complete
VIGACRNCNNGFSLDEEYLACLIECVIAGTTDPDGIRRERVAKTLRHSAALRARLEAVRYQQNRRTHFAPERDRVERVLAKLAKGHAAFELSQPCSGIPSEIWYAPLESLTDEGRDSYEASQVVQTYGEIGSRGMQRLQVTQLTLQSSTGESFTHELLLNDWVEVQEGRYRYHAADYGDEVRIRIVISEYLACEVAWEL